MLFKMEPKTSAFGERLWRGDEAGSWREAFERIVHHRQRLVRRRIMADQITQQWCVDNPGRCLISEDDEDNDELEKCQEDDTTQNNADKMKSLKSLLALIFVLFRLA